MSSKDILRAMLCVMGRFYAVDVSVFSELFPCSAMTVGGQGFV